MNLREELTRLAVNVTAAATLCHLLHSLGVVT